MTGLRIIVSGMVAGVPRQGGATWATLQYVLGLRELGHDVFLVEETAQPIGPRSAAYFRQVSSRFGLEGRSALLSAADGSAVGLGYEAVRQVAGQADLLVNLSGLLTDPGILEKIPSRLYVDLDPGFTQLWQWVEGIDMRFAAHTHFATIGWNIGAGSCRVPDCGLAWIPTWQPLVLSHWRLPDSDPPSDAGWSTVANWRGYGSVWHDGILFGQKAHSLRGLIDLPRQSRRSFRLALGIHPDEESDLALLRDRGWKLEDPEDVAGSPERYRSFIEGSRGEFGVAKSGYVNSRCGWFSDRSICYLGTGRPVVAQETGLAGRLPAGEGLFFFETGEDVLSAVEAIDSDYTRHSLRAREIADAHFDSGRVLSRLLDLVGGSR